MSEGIIIAIVAVLVLTIPVIYVLLLVSGFVTMINERQVGVVVKKISSKRLPPGNLIALKGEAGYQADTLAPGLHLGYWRWWYQVHKIPVTVIPQGEIGLIMAADGASNPPHRILGKVVDSDNFQNARKFLENGGEKGRQLGILTGGTYRINTAIFNVITSANAKNHGMDGSQLRVYEVEADMVGIATTLDGL